MTQSSVFTVSLLNTIFAFISAYPLNSVLEYNPCAEIQFVTREEWGANPLVTPANNITGPLEYMFVHHTADSECTTQDRCSSIMRAIQNFHVNDRGWEDIGYTFLIGGDGKVYVGRGWEKEGAHTYGYNRNAYGISLMGNFMDHMPSDPMINATKDLIACAVKEGYITEDYGLYGHRDGGCTLCPGDTFYPSLESWKNWHSKGTIVKKC